MRRFVVGCCSVLALLAAGCGRSAGSTGPAEARVAVAADGVRFTNPTDRTVYYLAFERSILPLILWGPCTRPDQCRSVPPRGEVTIPFADIGGYEPGAREAVIFYWRLVPSAKPGEHVVVDMQSKVVALP
jgi:hypothetical protein